MPLLSSVSFLEPTETPHKSARLRADYKCKVKCLEQLQSDIREGTVNSTSGFIRDERTRGNSKTELGCLSQQLRLSYERAESTAGLSIKT